MVNRIDVAFERLRRDRRVALMPYMTAGYPTLERSEEIVLAMLGAGATMVEIGMPFSDPLADGTTIQRATQRALANGVTTRACLEMTARVRARAEAPLLLMGYVNPMLRYGLERFVADAAAAGADGLIVPDVPAEEGEELDRLAAGAGLRLIQFLAPTSGDDRIARVAERAQGFIYCVSIAGVTGARAELSALLAPFLARVRVRTDVPLAVGFGISRPEHVARVATLADGAIVASALIDLLDRTPPEAQTEAAAAFVASLRAAADAATEAAGGVRGA